MAALALQAAALAAARPPAEAFQGACLQALRCRCYLRPHKAAMVLPLGTSLKPTRCLFTAAALLAPQR